MEPIPLKSNTVYKPISERSQQVCPACSGKGYVEVIEQRVISIGKEER